MVLGFLNVSSGDFTLIAQYVGRKEAPEYSLLSFCGLPERNSDRANRPQLLLAGLQELQEARVFLIASYDRVPHHTDVKLMSLCFWKGSMLVTKSMMDKRALKRLVIRPRWKAVALPIKLKTNFVIQLLTCPHIFSLLFARVVRNWLPSSKKHFALNAYIEEWSCALSQALEIVVVGGDFFVYLDCWPTYCNEESDGSVPLTGTGEKDITVL